MMNFGCLVRVGILFIMLTE